MAPIEHRDNHDGSGTDSQLHGLLQAQSMARYWWAAQAVNGKEVLDAGCGVGVGARILADAGAARVTGVESSEELALEATRHAGDVAEFTSGDIEALPFPPSSFDVGVWFETIEKTEESQRVIGELHRVLRDEGILLASSPSHELERQLAESFPTVAVHHQHARIASAIVSSAPTRPDHAKNPSLHLTTPWETSRESFTLALAAKREAPELRDMVLLAGPFDVGWWRSNVQEAQAETDRALRRVEEARARERHLAAERNLLAWRLMDAEQAAARRQALSYAREEDRGRGGNDIPRRDPALAAVQQRLHRSLVSMRRAASALRGPRR